MARLNPIPPDHMNEAQRAAVQAAEAGKRGRVPAPMHAWLRNPELAARTQQLGALLRYDTSLPPHLSELAILVTARHWTAQFEWYAHQRAALAAGIAPEIIAAIARRETPTLPDPASATVYRAARAIHEQHGLTDDLYAEALSQLGETALVELVALLGYYTLVAMTLNVFAIGVPAGEVEELMR
jgi:4-carboxymuconolactone decarboxylase